MQHDLREFLSRLAGTVVITLVPVVLTVFITLPTSIHHHMDGHPSLASAHAVHMS